MQATTIDRLKALHAVDLDIVEIERQLRHVPAHLEEQKAAVDRARSALDETKKRIVEATSRADRKELDIRTREGEIEKLEIARNAVKTNAEYERLGLQIESIRADISRLEEEALDLITKVDELKAERKGIEGVLEREEAEHASIAAEVEKESEGLRSRLEKLKSKRSEVIEAVPPDALSKYDRILHSNRGVAMAPVRNQVCQGCHMSVTTHDLTRIMKGNDLVLCRTCSRILYLEDTRKN
jgi:predicted  nucleic acid-binding Zn-ribbon protein